LLDHLGRAPRGLDLTERFGAEAVRLEDELAVELAATEDLHAVEGLLQHALLDQRLRRHGRAIREVLQAVQVDHCEFLAEQVPEAPLREAPDQWHLSALEVPPTRVALTGLLALVPLARGLSVTRAGAAAHALALFPGALGGPEVREVHDFTIS